jgi:hypothetical protein
MLPQVQGENINKSIKIKKAKILKKSDIDRQYQQYPSISDKLPWIEWSDECNAVYLLKKYIVVLQKCFPL